MSSPGTSPLPGATGNGGGGSRGNETSGGGASVGPSLSPQYAPFLHPFFPRPDVTTHPFFLAAAGKKVFYFFVICAWLCYYCY